jgi:glycosyltransferase involved in cell wall biosynthesis
LCPATRLELTVAIASLSIGGAERIVLDWAARIYPDWAVHLIVLYDQTSEWTVPSHVRVTRLHGKRVVEQLEALAASIADSPIPVCVCHLLRNNCLRALSRKGVTLVTVFHNAKEGWDDNLIGVPEASRAIAVSRACARDLRSSGWKGDLAVITHIPPRWTFQDGLRDRFRSEWGIPAGAVVVGMIGAVKPQKNYRRALTIFARLCTRADAYLVIVGGPVNAAGGQEAWEELLREVNLQGLGHRVVMPGFIRSAARCLPAFDVMLNTSEFEGLSISTLEALVNNVPVVASRVGGQGELACESLTLLDDTAPLEAWVQALERAIASDASTPRWADFPSYRLWTLVGMATSFQPEPRVLICTNNLSIGGAQRSLTNLATALVGRTPVSVAVASQSSSSFFLDALELAGADVERLSDSGDAFPCAEQLVRKICAERISTVCFWNLDAKICLLAVKALHHANVRFVDVSPGLNSFANMEALRPFQDQIAFTQREYYARLDALVLKYAGRPPADCGADKLHVIANGVPAPARCKQSYDLNEPPRIVVSGRLTGSKFIHELLAAMSIVWESFPSAEIHFFGAGENGDADYCAQAIALADANLSQRVFFHGPSVDVRDLLFSFDACVVLGRRQGCPNASLEAMAAGVPVVANDDGGTSEQIVHGVTGLLVGDCAPRSVADGLLRILSDRDLARTLGEAGRQHVAACFSMPRMVDNYLRLFERSAEPDRSRKPAEPGRSGEGRLAG